MVKRMKAVTERTDEEYLANIPQEEPTNGHDAQTAAKPKKVRTAYYLVMAETKAGLDWVVLQRLKSRKGCVRYVEQCRTLLKQTFSTVRVVRCRTMDEEFLR